MLDSATKDGLNIQLSSQKDKRKGAKCRNPTKRSLFPGYSLETAKRFDNKSIAFRSLGLIVIGEGVLQYQTYIGRLRESANDAITIPAIPAPIPTIPTR
jgi:hypothetical protein